MRLPLASIGAPSPSSPAAEGFSCKTFFQVRGTRDMGRNVVVDMRIRVGACCAFLAVLGGSLSACSSGDDGAAPLPQGSAAADAAASSPAAVDPWTLPIEDRPDLFDPCTEISLEDLAAAGLENPTPRPQAEDHSDNPPLHQCGWNSGGFTIVVGSIWTRVSELREEPTEKLVPAPDVAGKEAAYLIPRRSSTETGCAFISETSQGLFSVDLTRTSSNRADSSYGIDENSDTCQTADSVLRFLADSSRPE